MIRRLLQSPRARRGIAASAIVLSLGGLVLYQSDAGAFDPATYQDNFANGTTFTGPGAAGSFSLSHGKVLAEGRQRVFAELRLRADQQDIARERAPLALAIVLDTSGSMDGEKLADAKDSVIAMLRQMRDDDEVAFVRYDSGARLVQSMAPVGQVREGLIQRVRNMHAAGGTNIPAALRTGMDALDDASRQRVQRIVLVSDGLDSTRAQSESIARDATDEGVTVSALGIGLDFDESYMAAVARSGRGNFAFVQDSSTLARFLQRELTETAATTLERATVRISLPRHAHFVRAIGAEAQQLGDGELLLRLGSLFGGDERRVVIELETDAPLGSQLGIDADVSWRQVGGQHADIDVRTLSLVATDTHAEVERSMDAKVWASCTSALASVRQLDAAAAYARGDVDKARQIIGDNMADLETAAGAAPSEDAQRLRAQKKKYAGVQDHFNRVAPSSAEGRAAAKASTEQDNANTSRATRF
jgi:Ca-activated chloride channel family protein